MPRTTSCTAFNQPGSLCAYATSYDWSKGAEHHHPSTPNNIFLHTVKEEEIKPRKPKPKR